jgi:hypothetical protein
MHRIVRALALVGLLVACNAPSNAETDEATVSSSVGASGAASTGPSAACEESFAPIAEMELESTSELGDLPEVDLTIERCESVADWLAGAQQVVDGEIRPGAANLLLQIRCDRQSLSDTPLCEELAASS